MTRVSAALGSAMSSSESARAAASAVSRRIARLEVYSWRPPAEPDHARYQSDGGRIGIQNAKRADTGRTRDALEAVVHQGAEVVCVFACPAETRNPALHELSGWQSTQPAPDYDDSRTCR
jgi:hypothetical protein